MVSNILKIRFTFLKLQNILGDYANNRKGSSIQQTFLNDIIG